MADKLSALRSLIESLTLLLSMLYSFPAEYYHHSLYVSDRDRRMEFISRFIGSAGMDLITMNDAWLWTNRTYQKKQLSVLIPGVFQWKLHKMGARICEKAAKTSTNLMDQIWEDRPAAEVKRLIVQSLEFAGLTVAEKLQDLKEKHTHERACSVIISVLDEVLPHMKENKIEVQSYDAVGAGVSLLASDQLGFTSSSNTTEGKPGKDVKSGLLESAPTVEGKDGQLDKACNLIWMDHSFMLLCFVFKDKVLKGHIALTMLGCDSHEFICGLDSSGHSLDIVERIPLWKDGLDYRHGTGHGIGSYLNIHEGVISLQLLPFYICFCPSNKLVPLTQDFTIELKLQCLFVEPGYSEDGNFGVRLEIVLITKEANAKFKFGDKDS
ncbi:hypothetical protein Cgig2_025632 [Carnegiea gigantea]|uniref:Peptidase M24 domain-containing protein n=1 Tax=Carnegiea gigantea TaxID=171969 RepID=A0A9Q1JVE5_9CARY|nr:hypothetical protein Cgig2_025632 [Carnegiea gigantea]